MAQPQDKRPPAHLTREQDTVHPEVHEERPEGEWKPPSNLEAPPPRPGMSQLWVRTAIGSEDDSSNVAKQLREGWVPRRSDTVSPDFAVPTIKHGEYAGYIGIHGLVLMEMPTERVMQRRAHYASLVRRQNQAINQDILRVQSPSVPFFETRQSRVTVGRKVAAAEDPE